MARTETSAAPRIVIVGGGFAGAMVAANLLVDHCDGPLEVVIVEREARIDHLLNVPAGQMSAWAQDPGHFVRWADCLGGLAPEAFAPRRTYGRYVEAVLADAEQRALPRATLERIRGSVVDIVGRPAGLSRVLLADGRAIDADQVVLATGTPPPRTPPPIDPAALGSAYVPDPWAAWALERLPAQGRILLVGTGLTMVDVALALREQSGLALEARSRHGLLPRVHRATGAPPKLDLRRARTARELLRAFRAAVAASPDGDWRAVLGAVRPQTRAVWSALPAGERQRLLTRVGRHWDVHRHRMAGQVASQLADLRASGRLHVAAGRIVSAEPGPSGVAVALELPGGGRTTRIVDAVVNCTGPESDPRRIADPLLGRLLARGVVRPDAIALGLEVDERSRLAGVRETGAPLLALGWLCRGSRLESTAVPELRLDAVQVAGEAATAARRVWRRRAHDAGDTSRVG
jgi:uncharacterized NAD(P)/FAD-binding protein YdhS